MTRFAPPRGDWPLIVAGALLLSLAYPPFHLLLPSFLCLVPAVWLLLAGQRDARPLRRHVVQGWWFGLAANGLLVYWVVRTLWRLSVLAVLGYVAMVVLLSLVTAAVFALAGWFTRRTGLSFVVAFPLLWTVAEWVIAHAGDLRFPWLGLGTSLTGYPTLVQIADVLGARGVTLLLAGANAALAVAWYRRRERRVVASHVGAVVVGVLFAVGYGTFRERTVTLERIGTVAVLQPNVGWEERRDPAQREQIFERTLALAARAASETTPDLVVWPETAVPGYLTRRPQWRMAIAGLARAIRVPHLVGSRDIEIVQQADTASPPPYDSFNAAFLFDSLGRYDAQAVYHKQYLVPVTERVPFLPTDRLGLGVRQGFAAGDRAAVYEITAGRFGVLICFESIFEGLARGYRRRGADFLVNITNDEWFGRTSAPYQHMAHLVMRAIENRVGIARAANSGISGFVDPLGRVSRRTDLFTATFVRGVVFTADELTPYTRLGDWVGTSAVMLTILLSGYALWRRA